MKKELLSDQLKNRTLAPHQDLEKALMLRMFAMRSVDDYVSLLQLFYSYFGALEDRVDLYIGSNELPDYHQRRKSANLAQDIVSLGGLLPAKTGSVHIPAIENCLQAFGALYVMEGSTLGGLVISRMITARLNIGDNSLSFFKSYGKNLATMWNSFKLTLNRQADNETEKEIVISAAYATFQQFKVILNC